MLEDAQVPVCDDSAAMGWSLGALKVQVVCLDTDWEAIKQSEDNPTSSVTADNLAYVIYTSGS